MTTTTTTMTMMMTMTTTTTTMMMMMMMMMQTMDGRWRSDVVWFSCMVIGGRMMQIP